MEVNSIMRPEYDGVKFYGGIIGNNLERSANLLDSFDEDKEYTDINEVIELYNIQELINNGEYLKLWDKEKKENYKKLKVPLNKVLGKFFGQINDGNFLKISSSVCIEYVEDYWKLFVKYKVYQKVSGAIFATYINDPETTLWILLQQEELVKHYDKELADILRISQQAPRLIISKFLQRHDTKCSYHFPKKLNPSEYEGILQKYVNSDIVGLNELQILVYAQSTKECPISDKLRLSAKKACESFWEKRPFTGVQIGYGIGIEFVDESEIKTVKKLENNTYKITYDVKWFLENMDYPTILNNFRYVFEQFDSCWRSTYVAVKSQLGIFERAFSTNGAKEYSKGNIFNIGENLSTMQVQGCYEILKSKGVRFEDILKWFFEEYLFQEFGASGFQFNPPSEGTTMVEKCRTIASEMEGVLKQFRMYVQDGEINRELFEMSSEHIVFSALPGFIEDKYAYGNGKEIQDEQFMLFSDQSHLYYLEKTTNKYTCLFDLLVREEVTISDFYDHQKKNILWLIERNIIAENTGGYLKLNASTVFILKDLYDHDVICPPYYDGELKSVIDEWCKNGNLRLSNLLFSEPEQNYLNYELNKSSYSNGLDLRNKYAHSTYPTDEKVQFADYIRLLKIMILVVTKMNEEFCLREEVNGADERIEDI
jgi:hypothetical protein